MYPINRNHGIQKEAGCHPASFFLKNLLFFYASELDAGDDVFR